MCGIAGYIGKSKDPELTHKIISSLFSYNESRGTDASGYWGVESKNDQRILYHKEPIRSSLFVESKMWQDIINYDPDILITHARGTTPGIGSAKSNINNHPFISSDGKIALIHNGKVTEYEALKAKYEIKSNCDSEILLRIITNEYNNNRSALLQDKHTELQIKNEEVKYLVHGIKEIWEQCVFTQMAVVIGQKSDINNAKRLFMFRNSHRPLCIIDARDVLGQIFFSSTEYSFNKALQFDISLTKKVNFVRNIPEQKLWVLEINKNNNIPSNENAMVFSFDVDWNKQDTWSWKDKEKLKIKENDQNTIYVTGLDEKDEIIEGMTVERKGSEIVRVLAELKKKEEKEEKEENSKDYFEKHNDNDDDDECFKYLQKNKYISSNFPCSLKKKSDDDNDDINFILEKIENIKKELDDLKTLLINKNIESSLSKEVIEIADDFVTSLQIEIYSGINSIENKI